MNTTRLPTRPKYLALTWNLLWEIAKILDLSLKAVSWLGAIAATIAVIAMACLTATEVIARQVFHNPFLDAVTMGELAMVIIVFLGIAWVFREGGHVSVSLVMDRLPHKVRAWISIASLSIGLTVVGVVVYQTWDFAYYNLILDGHIEGGGLSVPAFPFQVLITIGFGIFGLEMIRRIVINMATALNVSFSSSTQQEQP